MPAFTLVSLPLWDPARPADPAHPASPDRTAAAEGLQGDERRRFLQRLHRRDDTARRRERECVAAFNAARRVDAGSDRGIGGGIGGGISGGIAPHRFDAAVDLLSLGPSCRDYDMRLKALADGLARQGFVRAMPGRPSRLALCDRHGTPRAAFRADKASLPEATEREWLAGVLDELLKTRHGLSLGFGRPVPHELPGHGPGTLILPPRPIAQVLQLPEAPAKSLQISALAGLFTNHWQAGWSGMPIDEKGRRWHLDADAAFPDAGELRPELAAMHEGRDLPPLFRRPDDASDAWDAPIDAGLRAKVAEIDTARLETDLLRALERRQAGHALRPAARQSIKAVKAVQALFARDPTLTLRKLLLFYPASLDWLDAPPDASPRARPAPAADHRRRDPPAAPTIPTAPTASTASNASPPERPEPLDDKELSAMRRLASPFNPFKARDKVLAPLLRDAVALRSMKPGGRRDLAAARLRMSLAEALIRIGDPRAVSGPRGEAREPRPRDERHRQVLCRLIADTENRYRPSIAAFQPPEPSATSAMTRRPWSWLPWRRRA